MIAKGPNILKENPKGKQFHKLSPIKGGPPRIEGCTHPAASNFDPAATQNDGSCMFDGPPSWMCYNGECNGPTQSTAQTFLWNCLNRNDCYAGCEYSNETFTCNCTDCSTLGFLWYNDECCLGEGEPIESEYWNYFEDMNFPEGINQFPPPGNMENYNSWDPYDSVLIVNCGPEGNDCPENPLLPEFGDRICAHSYMPHGGYEYSLVIKDGCYNEQDEFPGANCDDAFVGGIGLSLSINLFDGSDWTTEYCYTGAPVHMMIYKRAQGLLYRTDNYNNSLLFPKGLDMSPPPFIWYDWPSQMVYSNNNGYFTKVLPNGQLQYVGCTDPLATNYDPEADQFGIEEPGTCFYSIEGCTDPSCSNYNPEANVDDGSCTDCEEPETCASEDGGGCMNPQSPNFCSYATYDDGTCVCYGGDCEPGTGGFDTPVGGCTHPYADNFYCLNPTPYECVTGPYGYDIPPGNVFEDGSCVFDGDLPCDNDQQCVDAFGPTWKCYEEYCENFVGDVSGNYSVGYEDVCMLVSYILNDNSGAAVDHPYCEGVTEWIITEENLPFGNVSPHSDGINVQDVISLVQILINQILATVTPIEEAQVEVENLTIFISEVLGSRTSSDPNGGMGLQKGVRIEDSNGRVIW